MDEGSTDAFVASQRSKAGLDPTPTPADAPTTDPGETPNDPVKGSTPDPSPEESTETPTAQDTDPPPDDKGDQGTAPGEGSPEGEGSDKDNVDLDDETLAVLAETYSEKLLASDALKAQVEAQVKAQVETQLRETTATTEGETRVEEYIEQGRQAATRMGQLAEEANATQTNAAKMAKAVAAGEDSGIDGAAFDGEAFNPQEFKDNLENYGTAVVAEITQRYDNAFTSAFQHVLDQMPELTEDQQGEILKIVEQAKRMEGDPKQAAASKGFFTKSVLQFLYTSALDVGATQERTRLVEVGKQKKTISESAAVKQAAAKIVKNRGNPPPQTPGETAPVVSGEPAGAYDSDYYRGLKKDGKHAEAAAYVDKFGRGQVSSFTGV